MANKDVVICSPVRTAIGTYATLCIGAVRGSRWRWKP